MSEERREATGGSGDRPDPRDEAVRRLLADARHVDPLPVDVATAIDQALAGAPDGARTAESTSGDEAPGDRAQGTVVPLAAARTARRRWPMALAAAAVVVVAGVGAGATGLLGGLPGIDPEGASDGTALDAPTTTAPEDPDGEEGSTAAPDGGAAEDRPDDDNDNGGGFSAESEERSTQPGAPGLPALTSGPGLVDDVTAALATTDARPDATGELDRRCAPPYLVGEVVPVLLDGARADLVARPEAGGERQVTIAPCGSGGDLTVTVPAG